MELERNNFYHVKQLTGEKDFYRYHVHLDTRTQVEKEVAHLLECTGFKKAQVSLNCYTYANGQNPNEHLTEQMFRNSDPETWTIKTNCKELTRNAFRTVKLLMQQHNIVGYVEAETVHSDRPIIEASKQFDDDYFEKLCPKTSEKSESTFLDFNGDLRQLPLIVNQRSLNNGLGENAPVLEFHLSVNYGMLENKNVAKLLHAMGLISYEIPKLCRLPNGALLKNDDGSPYIIRERPLTLRLAAPQKHRSNWIIARKQFLELAEFFRSLIECLGGFKAPETHQGCKLFPVTFKLESLSAFYAQVEHNSLLPPVYDNRLLCSNYSIKSCASLKATFKLIEENWIKNQLNQTINSF